ncbi:hypothetical protein EDB92DRAFT_1835767 [Lactarius akahatsu]|uniref:Uncharacterized protein n=1 Tax=Lactarius akahatsu TaxID=416441 RepID=A0AAD4LT36_9AGAM|nr:hypothetical protein EDB92DRAFT_1835767 [Lactarius akahatsu]
MFICRLRLLPRPSPSFCSHVIITQRFSSRAATPSQQCLAVSTLHATPSSQTPKFDSPPSDPSDHLQYLGGNPPSWSDQDTDRRPMFPINQEETEKMVDSDPVPTLCELYARLRTPFSEPPTPLSIKQVHGIAIRARKEGCKTALDNLTRNILASPEPVRTELARTLLSIPGLHLKPSLTASLLYRTVPNLPSSLSLYASVHTAHILMHHPSPFKTKKSLACLAENIADALKLHQRYTPLTNLGHATRIWTLFRLRKREPAMRLLQSLIETSYIPPEAIHRVDRSSGDFHLIVTLTLVRSCIFWNWNRKALVLTRNYYLSKASSVGPAITKLCQDVLHTLMEFPTNDDLELSLAFINDTVSSPKPLAVSPGIIRQMYANAQHLNRPHIAISLFALSLNQAARSFVEFPLPSGSALTWLLRHLSRQAGHIHLTRRLVEQVVNRCEHIPLANRAEFISIAAESGFASPARTLWVRYSSGKEGQIVAGNAAMVVRMCSLFATLRRKAINKSRISQVAAETTISSVDGGLDDAGIVLYASSEEGEDLRNFANLVLTRFRKAKEPLQQASREDLNALARANIILGRVKEGLKILRVVPDRWFDIWFASGPGPDGVSFGTVVYQAGRHGDVAVITGLLRLARETGQQLTTKTVAAVIRASVVFSGKDKDAVRDNLTRALEIVIANEDSNHLASSNMGKFCIEEALKVDDPTLAFQFWNRLLRTRAEWDDDLHAYLRRQIAKSIHTHCKNDAGRQEMVSALIKSPRKT